MTSRVWIDGEPAGAEVASLLEGSGFLVGDGMYETMRIVDGRAFALDRHLARLRRGASRIAVDLPDDDALARLVEASVRAASPDDFVRLTVVADEPGGTRIVTSLRPGVVRTDPVDVVVVPWPRNERGAVAGVKSLSFGENQVARRWATARGADEALFADTRGRLCEGSRSNVFVVIDGRLVTPPLETGCLPGVTRELLLDSGVGVDEHVPMPALDRVSEMFLTSTGRLAQPVARLDGRALRVVDGEVTRAARDAISRSGGGG